MIGVGLALSPIHNHWLTDVVTNRGEVGFFLPAFGTAVWLMGALVFALHNWDLIREKGWGDKRIIVALLVIVGAIGLSGITEESLMGGIAPLLMGISLFVLYIVSRVLGKDIFLPLAIGAGIASLGVILHGIIYLGDLTGGFVFERNYDIVVGYILLGVALFIRRHQWLLASLALVAMFITGSPEAVFVVGVMGVVVLVRRDWSKRLVLAVAPAVIVAVAFFGLGYGQILYKYTTQVAKLEPVMGQQGVLFPLQFRLLVIQESLSNLKPLGEGYILTEFSKVLNVHNVPLVIVQQLGYPGILAGIAWLFVCIYCLIKVKWKYVWVLVLSLSVFDHFIWTQLAPWWWAIIGVTTTSEIKSDLLFRRVE